MEIQYTSSGSVNYLVIPLYNIFRTLKPSPDDLIKLGFFKDRWEVFEKLGHGTHGQVYAAYDHELQREVAIKAYKDKQHLKTEVVLLKKLENFEHFCKCVHNVSDAEMCYVVMDLKGPTMKQVLHWFKPLSLSTVMVMALQMLEAIKTLHKLGYIHNDIKASNFVIGLPPDDRNIYLVDFSVSKNFKSCNELLNKQLKTKRPINFNCFTPTKCRREDLYRLLYLMVEMRTDIPWVYDQGFCCANQESKSIEQLVRFRIAPRFLRFKSELDKLSVTDEPDYDKLKEIIISFANYSRLNLDTKTEWKRKPFRLWGKTYYEYCQRFSVNNSHKIASDYSDLLKKDLNSVSTQTLISYQDQWLIAQPSEQK